MTRERIKDFKEVVLPFFKNYFLKENYENLGKSDAEEFEKDFKEIIELADKALEQEPRWVLYEGDGYADGKMVYDTATCPNCGHEFEESDSNWQEACFCPNCGQALRWE